MDGVENGEKEGSHIADGVLVTSRKCDRNLDITACEAEFVPALKHAGKICRPIRGNILQTNMKGTIGSIDLIRFVIHKITIGEIDCFPIGVNSRIE